VFEKICEWKAMVEKATGKRLKVIHTDYGGEFTSHEFEAYLCTEVVCHELTIPKNPEQNGVAELKLSGRCYLMLIYHIDSRVRLSQLQLTCETKAVCEITPYEAWTKVKTKSWSSENFWVPSICAHS